MKPPQPPVSYDVIHWCERVDGQPSPRVIQRCGKTREDAIAAWNTRALSTSVASGEGWSRDKLARWLGSFPMHEDDRGPDNTVLIDLLPFTAGEDQGGETVLYRIVDELLSASPLPPNVPPVDGREEIVERMSGALKRIVEVGTRSATQRVGDAYDSGGWQDYETVSEEAEIAREALIDNPSSDGGGRG
jgi:hypothetical protein